MKIFYFPIFSTSSRHLVLSWWAFPFKFTRWRNPLFGWISSPPNIFAMPKSFLHHLIIQFAVLDLSKLKHFPSHNSKEALFSFSYSAILPYHRAHCPLTLIWNKIPSINEGSIVTNRSSIVKIGLFLNENRLLEVRMRIPYSLDVLELNPVIGLHQSFEAPISPWAILHSEGRFIKGPGDYMPPHLLGIFD